MYDTHQLVDSVTYDQVQRYAKRIERSKLLDSIHVIK